MNHDTPECLLQFSAFCPPEIEGKAQQEELSHPKALWSLSKRQQDPHAGQSPTPNMANVLPPFPDQYDQLQHKRPFSYS